MAIEYFTNDFGEEDPACGECGHPLENLELRFGRCRNCGGALEEEEDGEYETS